MGYLTLLTLLLVLITYGMCQESEQTCYTTNRFEYEYNVLQKLMTQENENSRLASEISSLREQYQGDRSVIEELATTVDRLRRIKTHGGTTYIRWGRTTCPDVQGTDLVYKGFVGGPPHQLSGGGANFLCLPTDPQWGPDTSPTHKGYVYGAEYYSQGTFWQDKKDHDVPCAVCKTTKTNVLIIPARKDCYDGWNREYYGYLMAERDVHPSNKEFICVDDDPEVNVGTQANLNGALLYFQETVCGSLPCEPYIAGKELV